MFIFGYGIKERIFVSKSMFLYTFSGEIFDLQGGYFIHARLFEGVNSRLGYNRRCRFNSLLSVYLINRNEFHNFMLKCKKKSWKINSHHFPVADL